MKKFVVGILRRKEAAIAPIGGVYDYVADFQFLEEFDDEPSADAAARKEAIRLAQDVEEDGMVTVIPVWRVT